MCLFDASSSAIEWRKTVEASFLRCVGVSLGRTATEAALPLHVIVVAVMRIMVASLGSVVGIVTERVSHGRSGARTAHVSMESPREVMGRGDRSTHLRHRVLVKTSSNTRSSGLSEIDRCRQRRGGEARSVSC